MGSTTTLGIRKLSGRKIENFSRMIKFYEDLLFGLALFSDCMEAYYDGKQNIFTLNKKTFQEIKHKTEMALIHARDLLQKIKEDKSAIAELSQFEFPDLSAFPLMERIIEQAQILVGVYERTFPGRPRSSLLSHDELISLMAEALAQFELLKTAERLSNITQEKH